MLNRIIRILATTLGALLLAAGCSKAPYSPASEQTPISFDAGSALLRGDAQLTRTSTLPKNTFFGVFAFLQPNNGTWNANRKPDYMFNVKVKYNGSKYTYSPIRFWPPTSTKLSFWAYYPYSSSAGFLARGSSSTAYTNTTQNLPDIRFTVDGHTDVMYSNLVRNQTSASNGGVVAFTFNHALSLVDVLAEKVDSDGRFTVKLTSVSFKGLYMTAILSSNADWTSWSWGNYSGARQNLLVWQDDPGDNSDDKVLAHNSPVSVGSVMPLPQSLSADAARLRVEFDVSYLEDPSDENTLVSYSTFREVFLRDIFTADSSTWTVNSHYTLTIQISPGKPIQFTVSWDDWGADHNYHLSS